MWEWNGNGTAATGESGAWIERTRDPKVAGGDFRRDMGDRFDAGATTIGFSSFPVRARTIMLIPSLLRNASRMAERVAIT